MKTLLRIGLVLLVCLCCAGGWLWHEANSFLKTPAAGSGKQIYFDVPKGGNLSRIAKDLDEAGLVSDAEKFALYARYMGAASKLKAGRFALNDGWTPVEILEALVNGKPALLRVTVPEGLTWWQTGRLLADNGLVRFDEFRDIIHDPQFLSHYGIPFKNAEGFLMPDTYLVNMPQDAPTGKDAGEFYRNQARAVAGRMIDNFWRKTAEVWPNAAGKSAANPVTLRPDAPNLKKWLTLASIVEKETAIDDERPRVAGVYENRLGKGMLLQADPTVIYGLGPDFGGALRKSQLEDKANPYNTYQNAGLPPGPISSVGLAALRAAVHPEKHDFLYFVAKTDGGEHVFSKTLDAHNAAARAYHEQKKRK